MNTAETAMQFKNSSDVVKESVSRKRDMKNEAVLQCFFNKIYDHSGLVYERETEKEEQVKGVDMYLYHKGSVVRLDEKTATSCWDRDLQTFCFELTFTKTYRDGTQHQYSGWFANDNQIADAYVLGYVQAPKDNTGFHVINSLEAIIVKKHKIWTYIKKCGYDSAEDLLRVFAEAIENNEVVVNEKKKKISLPLNGGLKLVQSFKMQEAPVNILVPKNVLIKLASYHAFITYKNGEENFIVRKNFRWK